MQVLTYMEFTASSVGRDAYIAYQKTKEEPRPAAARRGAGAAGVRNLIRLRVDRVFFKGSRYERVAEATLHAARAAACIRYKTTRFIADTPAVVGHRVVARRAARPHRLAALPRHASGSGGSATPTGRCGRTTCSRRRRVLRIPPAEG